MNTSDNIVTVHTDEEYIKNIVAKIKNYRKETSEMVFNEDHVKKWIEQFDNDDQSIVLRETSHLLQENYFSEEDIYDYFDAIWECKEIMGENPEWNINEIQFLTLTQKGKSHKKLTEMFEHYIYSKYNVQINYSNTESVNKYVYIDDCLFTGKTLREDIKNWINCNDINEGSELNIIFIAYYTNGYDYSLKKITEYCKEKNIKPTIFRCKQYNNDIHESALDFLWPTGDVQDEYINKYMERINSELEESGKKWPAYRLYPQFDNSTMFTSRQNRKMYENILLKKGAYIVSLPEEQNRSIRPMGYSYNTSLGFGAFFATCFNISNNCPLALWWGDPSKSKNETLGKWYPLLPREANKESWNWIDW